MNSFTKKAALAVFATAVGIGIHSTQAAAVIVQNGQSATLGGWTVSAPAGVALALDGVNNNTLDVEKTANFTSTNGLIVTFSQAGAGAVPFINFQNEAITNNSGSDWSGFQFLLNNASSPATFDGLGNVFAPPKGTGVNYTSVSLNPARDALTYTGTQANGSISNWGSSAAGDNLLIDANPGSGVGGQNLSFKELPETGGGGGNTVPLPAAAWQGLLGLAGLGVIAVARKKFKTA